MQVSPSRVYRYHATGHHLTVLTSRLVFLSRSTTATSSSSKSRIPSTSRRPGNSGASSSSDTLKAPRGRSSSSLSRRGSGRWVLLPSRSIEHRSIDRATTLYYAVPGGSACGVEGNTRRCGTRLAGCSGIRMVLSLVIRGCIRTFDGRDTYPIHPTFHTILRFWGFRAGMLRTNRERWKLEEILRPCPI